MDNATFTPEVQASSGCDSQSDSRFSLDLDTPAPTRSTLTLDSLADVPQWVAWQTDLRNDKPSKVPYRSDGTTKADSTRPPTWCVRSKARAAEKLLTREPKGHGICLGKVQGRDGLRIGGVDLDSCIVDTATGKLAPWAQEVVDRFASYTEISPSGTGVKIFFRYDKTDALLEAMGTTAEGQQRLGRDWSIGNHTEIALYLSHRYFAVTGRNIDVLNDEIRPVSSADLVWLIKEAGPKFLAQNGADKPDTAGKAKPLDESRSGVAFRLAGKMHREGKSFEEYKAALAADPDLAEWAKDERQVRRAWDNAKPKEGEDIPLNEDAVIRAFTERHTGELLFDHSRGNWFRFNGNVWRREETKLAHHYAREMSTELAQFDDSHKAMFRVSTWEAIERGARTERAFACTSDTWNRDHWLLGTPGGTVDLRTGELRPGRPEDRISRLTAVAPVPLSEFWPEIDCPTWLRFLDEALGGDTAAIRFLQQWGGYNLTGDTREQVLLFVHGKGGSGKGTAINGIADVLGEYAVNVGMETLTASKHQAHLTELARLHGPRMARASETEEGRAWAENRIKNLTGQDKITANFMRENHFEFLPEFKLTIFGNNKPILKNVDEAIRRRLMVLPFDHPPAQKDTTLSERLKAEWRGILSWLIVGCLDWQANGLLRPAVLTSATNEYFAEQDTFGQWIASDCETGTRVADTYENLWKSWQSYALANSEDPGSRNRKFPEKLQQRGFESIRDEHGIIDRGYLGIRVIERSHFDVLPG